MPPSIAHQVPGCPAFVPGIRLCGHSRYFPDLAGVLPVAIILRDFWLVRKRWQFVLSRIKAGNRSCYLGSMPSGFVLSRINEGVRLRAFADQRSHLLPATANQARIAALASFIAFGSIRTWQYPVFLPGRGAVFAPLGGASNSITR